MKVHLLEDADDDGSGASAPLPQTKKFMVGRTKTTAVCLKDGEVSQRHAELLWSAGDGWTLTDKGSSNGTKVNGATIKEGGAYRAVKRCTSPVCD